MAARICWLSVDPVRRKLDFYPRAIAARVEKAFRERGAWSEGTLNSSITLSTEHTPPQTRAVWLRVCLGLTSSMRPCTSTRAEGMCCSLDSTRLQLCLLSHHDHVCPTAVIKPHRACQWVGLVSSSPDVCTTAERTQIDTALVCGVCKSGGADRTCGLPLSSVYTTVFLRESLLPLTPFALGSFVLRFWADRSVKRVERPESGTVTIFSKQVPCLPLLASDLSLASLLKPYGVAHNRCTGSGASPRARKTRKSSSSRRSRTTASSRVRPTRPLQQRPSSHGRARTCLRVHGMPRSSSGNGDEASRKLPACHPPRARKSSLVRISCAVHVL